MPKAGAAAAAGDERPLAEAQRNNEQDLQRCLELLVTPDEEDLWSRLGASRWNAVWGWWGHEASSC